jgi:hypothetical protein
MMYFRLFDGFIPGVVPRVPERAAFPKRVALLERLAANPVRLVGLALDLLFPGQLEL